VGFALKKKEIAALKLAQARGCSISLALRNTTKGAEVDKDYNIDEVIKLLENEKNPVVVKVGKDEEKKPEEKKPEPKVDVDPGVKPVAPPPVEKVKVLVATRFIKPNTQLTADLVAEAFVLKEFQKGVATEGLNDLTPALGKSLVTGVAKDQWITAEMIGNYFRDAPQDPFSIPKPAFTEPVKIDPVKTEPTKPTDPVAPAPAPVKRKYFDVAVHTASGTIIHRYEELPEGRTRKVAELTPAQAAREDK
jgi:hypothetical protein